MIKLENDCVGCPDRPSGCYCHMCDVPHLYCDECQDDVEILHEYDGEQLCDSCFKDRLFTDFVYNYPIIDSTNYESDTIYKSSEYDY